MLKRVTLCSMPFMTEGAEAAIQAAQKGDGKVSVLQSAPNLVSVSVPFFVPLAITADCLLQSPINASFCTQPTLPSLYHHLQTDRLREVSQRRAAHTQRRGETVMCCDVNAVNPLIFAHSVCRRGCRLLRALLNSSRPKTEMRHMSKSVHMSHDVSKHLSHNKYFGTNCWFC